MVAHSVYGHVITKFSQMGRLPHFLSYGALLRAAHGVPLEWNTKVGAVLNKKNKTTTTSPKD